MIRFVFFGRGSYSLAVLKYLHARERTPVAVVTTPDSAVHAWCLERAVPTYTPTQLDSPELATALHAYDTDVFVVAGFRKLPERIFSLPANGTLNLHPSLLPAFRGRAPVAAQILADSKNLGVTIHVVDVDYDHGPIVSQTAYTPPIWPMAAQRLTHELAIHGARALIAVLPDWCAGKIEAQPQAETRVTQCRDYFSTNQYELQPDIPATELWRIYCALRWTNKLHFVINQTGTAEPLYLRTAYLRNDTFVVKTVMWRGETMSYDTFLHITNQHTDATWVRFSATKNPRVIDATVDAHAHNPTIRLREAIHQHVICTGTDHHVVNPDGTITSSWLLDFRNIMLQPAHLRTIAEIFWQRYQHQYPFQVGGQESAALPLITAIILYGQEIGKPANGFYIRKERKQTGLQKRIEGTTDDTPVILVDDLINTGTTQLQLVELLQAAGLQVSDIFTLVRYRENRHYRFASEQNITIHAPFTPFDLGLLFNPTAPKLPTQSTFNVEWKFTVPNPNLFHVVPKSRPVLYQDRILFGSDDGRFRALDQSTGTVLWQHQIWRKAGQKAIFSSPALHREIVYYGAYDGNVYALDVNTGKKQWSFNEADWVGSSPCIAADLNLVYVGLEFGLIKKRGGIVALDVNTGKKRWEYSLPGLTHGSPAYSARHRVVGVGSNDYQFSLFDAKTGDLQWQYQTGGEIRYAPAFDEKYERVLFGSYDGTLYACHRVTGAVEAQFTTAGEIYATPFVHEDVVYISSLDKCLYCLDRETLTERWRVQTSGKIFSSPIIINDHIYIGANDGFLYEINQAGEHTGFFHAGERIVNNVVYNEADDSFFLWTHANELYKLTRRKTPS